MWRDDWCSVAIERCFASFEVAGPLHEALEAVRLGERSFHLAVLVEPFLGYVLDGTKIVESRFTSVRVPPFRAVEAGDVILLKAASGPVVAACIANETWYFARPTARRMSEIRAHFGALLRDDVPGFWDNRLTASYVSLIGLTSVTRLSSPMSCPKQDRRGWVVLQGKAEQLSLLA